MRAEPPLAALKIEADRRLAAGALADALPLFRSLCTRDPADMESCIKLSIVERRLGHLDAAEKEARRAVRRGARIPMAHQALGLVLQLRGDLPGAVRCYGAALALSPRFPDAHYLLGTAQAARGRTADATAAFRTAIAVRPDHAEAMTGLAAALILQGDLAEAETLLHAALAISPDHPEALANLGALREQDKRADEALALYARASALAPERPEIVVQHASLLERQGRLDDARALLAGSPSIEDRPAAALVRARLARRSGDAPAALTILSGARKRIADPMMGGEMDLLAGQILDEQGEAERAFAFFAAGNKLIAAALGVDPGRPPAYLAEIERSRRMLAQWDGAAQPDGDNPAPIFLIGFPRSGTTLLEQMLDSHPAIRSMEERPALDAVKARFLARLGGAPPRIDAALRRELQAVYWAEVERAIGPLDERLLLDKLPLNLVWAHLARQLFPNACFLLALRHPMDACLSCFMQHFAMNEAMRSTLGLRNIALVYAAALSLWFEQQERLGIRPIVSRYEDLVADPETQGRRILAELGLSDEGQALDHLAAVRSKPLIGTPSYHQVARPVYRSAVARWRRYERHLAGVRTLLDPLAERLNYEV